MAVKGVIYNQEKTYLGLENKRGHWGGAVNGGAVLGEAVNGEVLGGGGQRRGGIRGEGGQQGGNIGGDNCNNNKFANISICSTV